MQQWLSASLAALALNAAAGENFVRNGNFERLVGWNGQQADRPSTPFAGWRWTGQGKVPAATPGRIELNAPGTLSCLTPAFALPAPEYALVFEVQTKGAKGNAYLGLAGRTEIEAAKPAPPDGAWTFSEYLNGARKGTPAKYRQTGASSRAVELPQDTGEQFVTLSATAAFKSGEPLPAELMVRGWLDLQAGSCVLRNVRIEAAPAAPAFRPRRDEWLTVTVAGVSDDQLPSFAGPGRRSFRVTNTSGAALSGTLSFTLDTWRTPGQGKAWRAKAEIKELASGAGLQFGLEPGELAPDSYVAVATLATTAGEPVVVASTAPLALGERAVTEGYNVLCFAVYPNVKPAKLFGVGNSMLRHQLPDDVAMARELGLVSNWTKGIVGAAYGAPSLDSETIDQFPPIFHKSLFGADPALGVFLNPLNPNMLDIFTPEGRAEIVRRGEVYGRDRRDFPGIYALRVNNEKAYFNRNSHCPSAAADANFREWCKARHGSLENLNRRWGTPYRAWEEVEQVISARMIDLAKASFEQKTGAAATDWKASSTFLRGEGYEKQLRKNWGQTMDWMRWTSASSVWMYSAFIDAARQHDPDTVYSNCFCWPNFWPAVTMPHFRAVQSAQLDVQYCAGFDGGARHDRHLGNNDEMIDILEMTESVIPGRPIIGNEVYVQPAYDADYPALQNWGLVAHGMSNIVIFGWRAFSDHGYKVFFDEEKKLPVTRYWEKPDSIACWMLFDTDGTKLPIYDSVAKSAREIASFHRQHDFWSTRRLPSRIGWYLANDSSELVVPISANRPWDNPILTSRFTLAAALRRAGVTMNYLDDSDLSRMTTANYDTLILPLAPVLSDAAATALAAFAQAGGRLIVIGPAGVYDSWLNLRSQFGGEAWREINREWQVPSRWRDPDLLMSDLVAYPVPATGSALRPLSPERNAEKAKCAETQLLTVPEAVLPGGTKLGDFAKRRAWGRGELIVVSTFPERRTQMPYPVPALRAYMADFLAATGLPRNGYFQLAGEVPADNHKQLLGRGIPEVEVVVRQRDTGDRFVFVLNCGGTGSGKVILPGPATRVFDALHGEAPVAFERTANDTAIPVRLSPWGYRVLVVTK